MPGAWRSSSDGRRFLAGGKGDIRFFDLERGLAMDLPGANPHSGTVERVAFLPGGRRAVSLDSNGRCVIWDVGRGPGEPVRAVATASPTGGRLLSVARRPGGASFAMVVQEKVPGPQSVRLFLDVDGRDRKEIPLPGPAERITAVSLSDDGNRVVLGTDGGRVVDLNIQGQRNRPDRPPLPGGAVKHLMIQPLWLLAGAGTSLHVLPGEDRPGAEMALGEPIEDVATSADGRRVAACGTRGLMRAWEIPADGGSAKPIALSQKVAGQGLSLAFSPGGDVLAAGDGSGQVRSWKLPTGEELPAIAPDPTGRVGHVAVAPDGRALLQITWDGIRRTSGRPLLWRFGDDSGARPIRGPAFQPVGGFLPDGDLVLIDGQGDVVVHRADTLALRRRFESPTIASGARVLRGSDALSLAISAQGNRVAAGGGEWACVWSVADGQLAVKPFRAHDDRIRAVCLSRDGGRLLTAADDGQAKLWDISADEARPLPDPAPPNPNAAQVPEPVTVAAFSPADSRVFALGRRDGTIELWNPGLPTQPWTIGPVDGEVRTLVFSPDGRLLAAAGDNRRITIVRTDRPGLALGLSAGRDGGLGPHHFEQINALAFWPDGKRLASASHDATIRLWRLDDRGGSLLGTLAGSSDGIEWVVFTPDGLFDGSAAGERRVTWRLDPKWWVGEGDGLVARLDQLGRHFRRLDLAESLRRGERPEAPARDLLAAPPRVILEPVAARDPRQRHVVLRARLSDSKTNLSLYHNGIPVPAEFKSEGSGVIAEATVTLIGGKKNRIHAMARGGPEKRPDDSLAMIPIDGLSNTLELEYDGPTPGRTHVLALGISDYSGQPLRYAHEDAQAIAEFLGRNGPGQDAGTEPIVLRNREVTRRAVERAFEDLRGRVRRHPEDTVVIFLAGHTTVRGGRFCLLLPNAILPDQPIAPGQLALRAPIGDDRLKDDALLPYLMVDFNLRSVDALQRVVIVNACEAEAIFDNLESRRAFRQYAHREAREARTSYILATRRGERTGETSELKHGLLTYTLLRGMGKSGLGPVPDLEIFREYPNADFNRNGWIETAELQEYARRTIPALAERFPGLLRGTAPARPDASEADAVLSPGSDESASFPLVESPRPDRPAARP